MMAADPKKRKQENTNDEPVPKRMKLNILPSKSTTEIVDTLAVLLKKMGQSRKTTTGGESSSLPLPCGLHIEGIGSVPLPICHQQLSMLLSLHSKSSNCFQLDPSQFHFANPNWNKNMQQLLQSVAISLGCTHEALHNVEAHLGQLIICTNNGKFSENDNTNTNYVIFSKLIVQLPSNYTTMDNKAILSVKYNNQLFDHDFGVDTGNAPFNTFFAAYFPDVESKHNEIASGVRICVTYNLCWKGAINNIPNINMEIRLKQSINNVLQSWDGNQCFAIGLKHQYKQAEISKYGMDVLKQSDFERVSILKQLNSSRNFAFFMAPINSTSDKVTEQWYDEKGKPFMFGKYFTLDLKTQCIDFQYNDDGTVLFFDPSRYIKNKDRYVIVIMNDSLQFNLIAKNSIAGAIKWVKNALDINPQRNCLFEMTYIVENINDVIDVSKYKLIVIILCLLQKKSYYNLVEDLVNNKLIPNEFGLHGTKQRRRRSYYSSYGNDNYDTAPLLDVIGNLIVGCGWNNPIRSAVLKLINCIEHVSLTETESYLGFMNVIGEKDCVSVGNKKQRTLLMCGYMRLQTTRKQFKMISDDIIQIVDDMYGSDCVQEIADKIWTNISLRFEVSKELPFININAETIRGIFKFIISCDRNEQKQKEMKDLFYGIYNLKVKQDVKIKFIEIWAQYLLSNKNMKYFEPAVDILMDTFDSSLKYAVKTISSILKSLNLEKFRQFVDKKLIAHNITKYNVYEPPQAYTYGWNEEKQKEMISKNYKLIIKSIVHVIVSNEWNYSLKTIIFKLIDSLNLETNVLLMKQIKQTSQNNSQTDQDDDIIILNNTNENNNITKTNCSKKCLEDIKMRLEPVIHNRIQYLSSLKEPKFTWKMLQNSNVIVDDETFTTFLKSEQRTFNKYISGIANARRWSPKIYTKSSKKTNKSVYGHRYGFNSYSHRNNNYEYFSIEKHATGVGKNAHVVITKTKEYFNKHYAKKYQRDVAELKELLSIMNP